ncbi:branched-chain amino acid ABC transporter substrate-binding protein [Chryseobacterium nematophagum]|nr:branched-chain amino acid ABC transporter substrate-binding protein [Chryseobacterium nematophagum]
MKNTSSEEMGDVFFQDVIFYNSLLIMNWNFLEILSNIVEVVDLFTTNSSSARPSYNKKTKYLVEKISFTCLAISAIMLGIVFKNSLPEENLSQTIIVILLMGIFVACLLFFVLYVLELYYFKNIFQCLFFSGSIIILLISSLFFIYFKSGLFL